MRVRDVMTEGVRTVPPSMAADDAWQLMRQQAIHHLVVARDRAVIGVLSDADAGGRAGAAVRAGRTVGDLMTRRVATVAPDDPLRAAANVMRGRAIGCVPVVERGRVVGLVTLDDLLAVLGRGVDRPATPSRKTATHRVPHRHAARGSAAW